MKQKNEIALIDKVQDLDEQIIEESGIKPNRQVPITVNKDKDGTITVIEHYSDLVQIKRIKYPDGRFELVKIRNFKLEKSRRKRLYEEFGFLLALKGDEIPKEHRTKKKHLRCFKKVHQRDEHGNKQRSKEMVRCGNGCVTGSLFCKRHGGSNVYGIKHGLNTDKSLQMYRKAFGTKLGAVLERFVNDPDIMSHKRELATLRTLMLKYIARYSENTPIANSKKLVTLISGIADSGDMTSHQKFMAIYDVCMNEKTIIDGDVMDRITRLCETIGRTIERIDKVERKSDFFLTPEGLKIVIRSISDILKTKIKDTELLNSIRNQLMMINTRTVGEIPVENQAKED